MNASHLVTFCVAATALTAPLARAQAPAARPEATITLSEPAKKGGLPVLDALAVRASVRDWAPRPVSMQDLSDLLWAANGINRPDGRRTAASALNAQDVDIYVFVETGVYVYDAKKHALTLLAGGDHRAEVVGMPGGPRPGGPPVGAPGAPAGQPPAGGAPRPSSPAPVQLFLVSDNSRFGGGTPELRAEWGAIDAGIVSQNIALFCAARGLATRPRAGMNKEKLRSLLSLKDSQKPVLNLPVGYPVAAAR